MSRALDDLNPIFKPLAIELLARIAEAGIPIMIIDTLRTEAEHKINLANGTSQIKRSKHQDGLAIDVCPYSVYQISGPDKLNWDTSSEISVIIWNRLGVIGKNLGLRWGGNFKPISSKTGLGWDPGHFEYVINSL